MEASDEFVYFAAGGILALSVYFTIIGAWMRGWEWVPWIPDLSDADHFWFVVSGVLGFVMGGMLINKTGNFSVGFTRDTFILGLGFLSAIGVGYYVFVQMSKG